MRVEGFELQPHSTVQIGGRNFKLIEVSQHTSIEGELLTLVLKGPQISIIDMMVESTRKRIAK